jgi:hypothetical protein
MFGSQVVLSGGNKGISVWESGNGGTELNIKERTLIFAKYLLKIRF